VQIFEAFVSLPGRLLNFRNLNHARDMLDDFALLDFQGVCNRSGYIIN
jgi:hypothetical protein